jgi:hypothetical protein
MKKERQDCAIEGVADQAWAGTVQRTAKDGTTGQVKAIGGDAIDFKVIVLWGVPGAGYNPAIGITPELDGGPLWTIAAGRRTGRRSDTKR